MLVPARVFRRRPTPRLLAPLLLLALLAACAPAVRGAGPAVTAPALAAETFRTADNQTFRVARWEPAGPPRAVILGLHGLNSHARGFLSESVDEIVAGGVRVVTFDQRNHGRNPNRGIWPGEAALVDDAEAALRLVRAENPSLPLYVLGESMGANIALLLQDRFARVPDAPRVDGWAALSPGLWTLGDTGPVMAGSFHLALRTFPGFAIPTNASQAEVPPTDNMDALRRLESDPDVIQATRVDAVWGLLGMMEATLPRVPACCAAPTLVMLGARDPLLEQNPVRAALRGVPPERSLRVARYPEGRHMLLYDRGRSAVVRDILAFTADPRAPLPSGADRLGAAWMSGGG